MNKFILKLLVLFIVLLCLVVLYGCERNKETVPDAPTGVSATAGNAQAIVTFTAPVDNGGSPITGYTVISSPGGIQTTRTLIPITVPGLTNLTAYTIAVVATNINGNSAPSAASNSVLPGTVTNPTTGKIWMDRNLGANQVATSSTDEASYGHLFQWGRLNDGHQIRTSGTTTTLSSSNTPGHGNFILAPNSPYDWCSPQNSNLCQGVSGTNNPCPIGYRLPTEAEWDTERLSWGTNNAAGAFASPLKLPTTGSRYSSNGSLNFVGSYGNYGPVRLAVQVLATWTSTAAVPACTPATGPTASLFVVLRIIDTLSRTGKTLHRACEDKGIKIY